VYYAVKFIEVFRKNKINVPLLRVEDSYLLNEEKEGAATAGQIIYIFNKGLQPLVLKFAVKKKDREVSLPAFQLTP
jgi:hypothetical protein